MKVVMALLVAALPLSAQVRSRGPQFSVGIGGGSLGAACDSCSRVGHQGGLALHLWIGAPIHARLLVGLEIDRWDRPERASAAALSSLTAGAHFYPSRKSPFFVSGGVGLSSYDNSVSLPAAGLGVAFGPGMDIRVGRNFALTPALRLLWGTPRDVRTNEQLLVARGLQPNLIAVAVSASFGF